MGNPVTWFEILGPEGNNLKAFYGDLFDWSFQTHEEMKYHMTQNEDGINGGIGEGQANWAIFYVEVASVEEHLAKIQDAGGEIVVPRTAIPDMVTFAVCKDPAGNHFGIVESDRV